MFYSLLCYSILTYRVTPTTKESPYLVPIMCTAWKMFAAQVPMLSF